MNNYEVTANDIKQLEAAYAGRKPYHGELHDHTNSGGTSDGKVPMAQYKEEMPAKKMDFAAILDHRQARHTYLPEFDRDLFICGTEPGTRITDADATENSLHYNMLFPGTGYIEKLVSMFPEYEFTGGQEGHFVYPSWTHEEFKKIIRAVKDLGGFFVIPHPKQILYADDPLEYYFMDWTGIEVFYKELDSQYTKDNYELYTALLDLGKRVWVCAGGDKHAHPDTGALTTIYSDRQHGDAYLPYLKAGDFTAGNAGVKMIMTGSDTNDAVARQGGHCIFGGQRLVASAGDLHESVYFHNHIYRFVLMDDQGIVCEQTFTADEICYLAADVNKDARWYRTEVFDETRDLRIAMSNPIWNDSKY